MKNLKEIRNVVLANKISWSWSTTINNTKTEKKIRAK